MAPLGQQERRQLPAASGDNEVFVIDPAADSAAHQLVADHRIQSLLASLPPWDVPQ